MATARIPAGTLERLKALLGAGGWLEGRDDVEPFLVDHRKLYRGATPLVALPRSTADLAALVAACAGARIGMVPIGGNTGYCGGATPDDSGSQVVVCLRRMNRVRDVDVANQSMVVEAGCVLQQLQAVAEQHDRLLPLSLGAEGSCTIGGNLSTNAGGTAVLRYGMARDLVLGLEVVLPDGRVLDQLRSLRKDNTGYDLKQLFIGAEGTLGFITAACLKLFPRPRGYATALVALDSPQAAVTLLARLRDQLGDSVTTFELVPRYAVELACRHIEGVSDPFAAAHDWYALVEVSLPRVDSELATLLEAELAASIESADAADAVLAASLAQRDAFWRLRESIPEAQTREGTSLKHDISVAVGKLPQFIEEGTRLVRELAPDARPVTYGHLGDGNLHFNFNAPPGDDGHALQALAEPIGRAVHDLVARYGGSFSAEHGIGQRKVDELERYEDPVSLGLMRDLKQLFDPLGIMNPGKVLRRR